MIVLDASTAIELVMGSKRGESVRDRILAEEVAVPDLIDVEVLHVLRRYERAAKITNHRAERALSDLLAVPMTRYPHTPLLPRMWQLRGNLSGYDAAYVALAELFEAPLLTCDVKLAASPGHRARIESI
jgi:predicted nucleic acid-binding protein